MPINFNFYVNSYLFIYLILIEFNSKSLFEFFSSSFDVIFLKSFLKSKKFFISFSMILESDPIQVVGRISMKSDGDGVSGIGSGSSGGLANQGSALPLSEQTLSQAWGVAKSIGRSLMK